MSSLAINAIGDEPITATEYRSEFLRDGVKYSQFLCPFCHIPLSPIAIYVIEKPVKSPHFRKQTEHIGKCDGEPIFINVEKREPKKYIPPKDTTFPEVFIKRRRPRITTTINTGSHRGPLSLDEINEARARAGLGGAHRSTATILQPFVYAYNHVWKEGFRIYPGDIKKSDRNTWIRRYVVVVAQIQENQPLSLCWLSPPKGHLLLVGQWLLLGHNGQLSRIS